MLNKKQIINSAYLNSLKFKFRRPIRKPHVPKEKKKKGNVSNVPKQIKIRKNLPFANFKFETSRADDPKKETFFFILIKYFKI